MEEVSRKAAEFLENVFRQLNLRLQVTPKTSAGGELLDIHGHDAELLEGQTGELLDAFQHLLNQIYGRSLPTGTRLTCDVAGFRATREAELKAMANLAAQRVRDSGVPFIFEPMSAHERRIIHLTLAESDDLYTESVGEGSERKLRIAKKKSS